LTAIFIRWGFPGQALGQVWNSANIFGNWTSIAMTSDGTKIAAAGNLGGSELRKDGFYYGLLAACHVQIPALPSIRYG
jgi:bisphosphoglycerate-dependent phosphoglycerate mutase